MQTKALRLSQRNVNRNGAIANRAIGSTTDLRDSENDPELSSGKNSRRPTKDNALALGSERRDHFVSVRHPDAARQLKSLRSEAAEATTASRRNADEPFARFVDSGSSRDG